MRFEFSCTRSTAAMRALEFSKKTKLRFVGVDIIWQIRQKKPAQVTLRAVPRYEVRPHKEFRKNGTQVVNKIHKEHFDEANFEKYD